MPLSPLTLFELAAADPEVRFSPHCWKVRMALAHKGLEATRAPWRFSQKDQIAFSGQGLVPVLVDGDEVLTDSWRIALHLEARHPDRPSLFGQAVPLAQFVNAWADSALLPRIARLIIADIHRNIDLGDQAYFRTSREKRFGAPLEKVSEDTAGLLKELDGALSPLRSVLNTQPFLGGETALYADYSVFGMFMWPHCISPIELLQANDPVYAWRERLMEAFDGMGRNAPVAAAA